MAHNGAEHSLEIEGRADRLTHFTQRPQLAHRLRQLARAGLQFLKQPHVLDGDDRLASESFEQSNVSVRKWTHFHASEVDSANRRSLSDHRRAEICPDSPTQALAFWKFVLALLKIMNMQRLSRKNRS